MKKLFRYRFFGVLVLILGLGAGTAYSQSITVSVPDSKAEAGEIISLPISVTEILESDNVLSGEWRFTTSSDLVSFQEISTTETLLEGVNTSFNSTSGNFAFAATQPISGSGILVNLLIQIREDAVKFEESEITITAAVLNEGEPQLAAESGVISIRGIEVSPKKPTSPLIEGQTFQFSLNGDVTPPVTWTSSDNSIATVTQDGLAEGIVPGTVKIFVEDAAGLTDETDFFRVEPVNLQELTLGVSDKSVTQTLVDSVQILVSDLTGLNITSGQFDLNFTSSKLEFLSLSTDGTLMEGRPDPAIFQDGSSLRIAFADSDPIEGEGALLNIVFRVNRNATGTASFTPQNVLFNENFEAATTNGTVTILDAPDIVVDQQEDEITIGETQIYSVISGGTPPYKWFLDNDSAATIDEDTGELTGISRGIVNIIAVDADNFESEPVQLTVNDVTVSVPDTDVLDFETFSIPLNTTDITGLNITSFEVDIEFDADLLNFESVDATGTISDGLNLSSSVDNGTLKIAAASATPLEGSGPLLSLNFSIQETASFGSSGTVNPARVQFNEPGGNTPTATERSGVVNFLESNLPAQVTLLTPADSETNVSLTPEFTWNTADRAESYQLEVSTEPDMSAIVFSITDIQETTTVLPENLQELTNYYWRVRAVGSAGTGSWSEIWSFETLPGIAEAPVLSVPANNATEVETNVTLRWFPSRYSESYLVELSTDALFEEILLSENASDTLYTVSNLLFDTNYYWRVTGVNVLGSGETSSVFSFTTESDITGPVVDASASTVEATSPHTADGTDASTVTVGLVDTDGAPISGFTESDFAITVSGSASAGSITETATQGTYTFDVTNTVAETVTVTVTAGGTELTGQLQIVFEVPEIVVDASASTVEATTPHIADGTDASTVTVGLVDTDGAPISGFTESDFTITVSGSVTAGTITETATEGTYSFDVTNTVAETVTITIIADGTELETTPQITFEEVIAEPIPPAPFLTSIQNTDNGTVINWQVNSEEFIASYNIYRGASSLELDIIDQTGSGTNTYVDSDPPEGSVFYAVSAVNNDGAEGFRSAVLSIVNVNLSAGLSWSLVSVPVQESEITSDLATIFSYQEKYNVTNTLRDSKGYWVKTRTFDSEIIPVNGVGLDSTDIQLNSGWNLIGSVSDTVSTSSIIDENGILTDAPVFIYDENQYQALDQLIPNKGHWIFASEPGIIEFGIRAEESMAAGSDLPLFTGHLKKSTHSSLPSIQFSVDNITSEIYISDYFLNQKESIRYLLPPAAPDPVLDVRSDHQSALVNSASGKININSTSYPVRAEITGLENETDFRYRLILEKKGEKRTLDLIPGQVNEIGTEYDAIYLTKVDADELITEHKLFPNYPNPFNPTTTIQYQVREQSHVKIEVFDVVGRRVKLLADEVKFSGDYQVSFDARDLSSGIYIIRFIAGNHIDIRKMTLIK